MILHWNIQLLCALDDFSSVDLPSVLMKYGRCKYRLVNILSVLQMSFSVTFVFLRCVTMFCSHNFCMFSVAKYSIKSCFHWLS